MSEFTFAAAMAGNARMLDGRPAVLHRDREVTYRQLVERSQRLARFLGQAGLGVRAARSGLARHEMGQDMLAQYLHNGPEYLEGLLGAWSARVAAFNVNYRYVADELRYLFLDSRPRAIQYHGKFAQIIEEILDDLPFVEVLLRVDDGSGDELLPRAIDYGQALASADGELTAVPSPDDLYVLYTGGTTGQPKGVLWRHGDAAVKLFGIKNHRAHREWETDEERLAALTTQPERVMTLAPFMHGAAQWGALQALGQGHTVVLPDVVDRLDPADAWNAVVRHGVTNLAIAGNAFGRPLADELEAHPRSLTHLRVLISGGSALHAEEKERLRRAIPHLRIIDSIGSSETGIQGRGGRKTDDGRTVFDREPDTVVLSDDRSSVLLAGHTEPGWLATMGRVPLGYLGDAAKTSATFPQVDDQRYSIAGDRARLVTDTLIEVLGRDSVTINTGGEKVFAEEVEAAIIAHPEVADAVVCGRPSERWGSEVVALVQPVSTPEPEVSELIEFCARSLARYKLPKSVVFVDEVKRSPSGKADYRWAVNRSQTPTR